MYMMGVLTYGGFVLGSFCPWGFCPRGFCPTLAQSVALQTREWEVAGSIPGSASILSED